MKARVYVALVFGLAVGPTGCSSGDARDGRQPVVPAGGVVRYKNKPVANADVTFQSLDGTVSASGSTDVAGAFKLTTYEDGDGAPAGKYRVLVAVGNAGEVEDGVLAPEPDGGFRSPIPEKYATVETSDILREVTTGGKNEFTIDLK